MKKTLTITFKMLAVATLTALTIVSCNKEYAYEAVPKENAACAEQASIARKSAELLCKVIRLTVKEKETVSPDNPVFQKLEALDIRDENDAPTPFFTLSEERQSLLLESLMEDEAESLAKKLNQIPELQEFITKRNSIISELVERYSVKTKAGNSAPNAEAFLSEMTDRINDLNVNYVPQAPQTKSSNFVKINTAKLDPANPGLAAALGKMYELMQPGDILLTMPNPDAPISLLNFKENNNGCMFGHSEMITDQFTGADEYFRNDRFQTVNGTNYWITKDKTKVIYYTYKLQNGKISYDRSAYDASCKMLPEILELEKKVQQEPVRPIEYGGKTLTINEANKLYVQNAAFRKHFSDKYENKIYAIHLKISERTNDNRVIATYYTRNPYGYDELEHINIIGQHTSTIINNSTFVDKDEYYPAITETPGEKKVIGCWTDDGVTYKTLRNPWMGFENKWHVMGLAFRVYSYNKSLKRYNVTYCIDNSAQHNEMVSEVKKHLGKQYTNAIEFAFAKAATPKKFTCTSLIWYAVKTAYGVDLSSWYSTLVSPADLYTSNYTYIKCTVEPSRDWYLNN